MRQPVAPCLIIMLTIFGYTTTGYVPKRTTNSDYHRVYLIESCVCTIGKHLRCDPFTLSYPLPSGAVAGLIQLAPRPSETLSREFYCTARLHAPSPYHRFVLQLISINIPTAGESILRGKKNILDDHDLESDDERTRTEEFENKDLGDRRNEDLFNDNFADEVLHGSIRKKQTERLPTDKKKANKCEEGMLQIFDGQEVNADREILGICGRSLPSNAVFITSSSDVTISYFQRPEILNEVKSFNLSFSYFIERKSGCISGEDFQCANSRCISQQLICDNVNNCDDRSDEVYEYGVCSLLAEANNDRIFGGSAITTLLVAGGVLFIGLAIYRLKSNPSSPACPAIWRTAPINFSSPSASETPMCQQLQEQPPPEINQQQQLPQINQQLHQNIRQLAVGAEANTGVTIIENFANSRGANGLSAQSPTGAAISIPPISNLSLPQQGYQISPQIIATPTSIGEAVVIGEFDLSGTFLTPSSPTVDTVHSLCMTGGEARGVSAPPTPMTGRNILLRTPTGLGGRHQVLVVRMSPSVVHRVVPRTPPPAYDSLYPAPDQPSNSNRDFSIDAEAR